MCAWARLVFSLGLVVFSLIGPQAAARAQSAPNPLEASVQLGPGKVVRVAVIREAEGLFLVADGKRATLPLRDAAKVEASIVLLAKGRSAAVVTVSAEGGARAGAVLVRGRSGLEIAFVGPLDPRGDAGERAWSVIETKTDAASEPTLVVSQRQERTAVCGEQPAAIAASALDPQSGKLTSLAPERPFGKREIVEVAATATSPGPQGAPALKTLRMSGVSSARDFEPLWLASPISSLTDGDVRTAWSTAADRPAQHAFITLSLDAAGREVRAFSITPRAVGIETAQPPRSFWLVNEDGPVLHVTLAEPVTAGQAQWVALPTPRAMKCVSLVIDAVHGGDAGKPGSAQVAELAAYTDLDFGGGVERLIAELSAGGAQAARAVDVLRRFGPSVVGPLVAAVPSLAPGARARAVRVWSAYLGDPAARSALQAALDDPDARVRELAHTALAEGDASARAILVSRIAYAGPSAEAAASALARTAPKEAGAAVLAAMAADGASERPALRDALSASCEQLKTACTEIVRAWLAEATPKVPARAAVALAISHQHGLSGVPELVAELIAGAASEAKGFEERWRLVNAATRAAASAPIDGWLAELVAKEERWMLRAAALAALSQRKSPLVASTAKQALNDEYPRVRLVAVQAVAEDASATADLTIHAQRDRWPMVRSAAYDALAKHTGVLSSVIKTLEGGVSDPAKSVRASALRALTAARVITAWPVVEKVLQNDNEWPEVTIEAAGYARALCVRAAREPLVALLVRALKPDAAPFEAEVGGPVFEALADLGGEAAAAAQKIAARSTSPAGLKAMAKRAAARAPACAAQPAAPAPAM
jgi:HEAT repeat protein